MLNLRSSQNPSAFACILSQFMTCLFVCIWWRSSQLNNVVVYMYFKLLSVSLLSQVLWRATLISHCFGMFFCLLSACLSLCMLVGLQYVELA